MKGHRSSRVIPSRFNRAMRCLKPRFRFRLRSAVTLLLAFALIWQAILTPVALASGGKSATKTPSRKAAAAPSMLPVQAGSSIILFGPRQFTYQPGPARNVYEPFTLPISAPVAGTVRIENGGAGGAN